MVKELVKVDYIVDVNVVCNGNVISIVNAVGNV